MDAFVQILILMAFLAGGALLHLLRLSPRAPVTDRLIRLVLWALLSVMGFRLGNARELSSRLGEIGLLAGATAVLAVAGTMIAIWLTYDVYEALGSRKRGRPVVASTLPVGSAGPVAAPSLHSGLQPGFDLAHFKGPGVLLGIVVLGFVAGVIAPEFEGLNYGLVTGWVLNALLFMIGVQFAQSGLSLRSAFLRADTLIVPLATVAGSLAGGLVVALLFDLSAGKGLALSAGFGWYSLSGVLISDMGDAMLGSAAFLANMMREALALVLIPVLAVTRRPYMAVGVGGATAMDVTLPLIEQCIGPDAVPVSFTSGALLSLLVPMLVPLFYRL
ncbi:MAG: lysine exporter LysO family protein [Spirochaetota bacterium]